MRLRRWKCHKVVEAERITGCRFDGGDTLLVMASPGNPTVRVDSMWIAKHARGGNWETLVGGYFVRYADDYSSWSPREAFEQGYTEIAE